MGMIAGLFVLTSCETDGTPGVNGSGAAKSGSQFLTTDYEPLEEWFEERFQVKYRDMTPELIFDQVPINQINYDTEGLPANAPKFDLESNNLSRREILKRIADFWNLKMSIINGEDGNPSVVKVRKRA